MLPNPGQFFINPRLFRILLTLNDFSHLCHPFAMENQPLQKQEQSQDSSFEQESQVGGVSRSAPAFQLTASDDVMQLTPQESAWGKFHDTKYENVDDKGVDIDMDFEPGENVDATKIAFSQVVRTSIDGDPVIHDPSLRDRQVDEGSDSDGYRIDRLSTKDNPVYGAPSLGAGKDLEDTSGSNSKFKLGHQYEGATPPKQNAFMHDKPKGNKNPGLKKEFESTALAIDGNQKGTYYGSVRWGYEIDSSGTYKKLPFALESEGTPSNDFMAAAQEWNDTTARGTVVTKNDDTISYKKEGGVYVEDFKVAKDVEVRRKSAFTKPEGAYQKSEILTGDKAGQEGIFRVDDLVDKGDGDATIDLPVQDVHEVTAPVKLNEGVSGPWRSFDELSVGDRVIIKDDQYAYGPWHPDFEKAGKVMVEVVQGSSTGAVGWIPVSAVKDENDKVG